VHTFGPKGKGKSQFHGLCFPGIADLWVKSAVQT